jgi:hypothetical protein
MKLRESQESQIAIICSALSFACLLSSNPAFAGWGKLTVTDGNGDGVQVKHYLLGQKSLVMQDSNGDQVEHKEGLFGINRETGVNVLGNGTTVKHGLLRGTSVEGQDMLGDSWKSKKMFMGLGPRVTTVNAKGVSDMLNGFMHGQIPGQMMPPGQMYPGQMMMPERAGSVPASNFSQYAPARGFGEPQPLGTMPAPAVEPAPGQP